jgi:hypothetical protein
MSRGASPSSSHNVFRLEGSCKAVVGGPGTRSSRQPCRRKSLGTGVSAAHHMLLVGTRARSHTHIHILHTRCVALFPPCLGRARSTGRKLSLHSHPALVRMRANRRQEGCTCATCLHGMSRCSIRYRHQAQRTFAACLDGRVTKNSFSFLRGLFHAALHCSRYSAITCQLLSYHLSVTQLSPVSHSAITCQLLSYHLSVTQLSPVSYSAITCQLLRYHLFKAGSGRRPWRGAVSSGRCREENEHS